MPQQCHSSATAYISILRFSFLLSKWWGQIHAGTRAIVVCFVCFYSMQNQNTAALVTNTNLNIWFPSLRKFSELKDHIFAFRNEIEIPTACSASTVQESTVYTVYTRIRGAWLQYQLYLGGYPNPKLRKWSEFEGPSPFLYIPKAVDNWRSSCQLCDLLEYIQHKLAKLWLRVWSSQWTRKHSVSNLQTTHSQW